MSWCTCAHFTFFFWGSTEQQLKTKLCWFITHRHVLPQETSCCFFLFVFCIHCFLWSCFETMPDLLCSLCCCITINNRVSYLTAVFCFQAEFCIYPFLGMRMQHPWRLPSRDSSLLDPFCFSVVLSSLQWYCFLNLFTICFRLYSCVCIVIICPILHYACSFQAVMVWHIFVQLWLLWGTRDVLFTLTRSLNFFPRPRSGMPVYGKWIVAHHSLCFI